MLKRFNDSNCFSAGDNTWLRELLHPVNDSIKSNFSLAHAYLEAGECSLPHRLISSSETYFILEGEGTISINDKSYPLSKFDTIYVPSNAVQSVKNTGSKRLEFLCIVSPPWSAHDEEILAN